MNSSASIPTYRISTLGAKSPLASFQKAFVATQCYVSFILNSEIFSSLTKFWVLSQEIGILCLQVDVTSVSINRCSRQREGAVALVPILERTFVLSGII